MVLKKGGKNKNVNQKIKRKHMHMINIETNRKEKTRNEIVKSAKKAIIKIFLSKLETIHHDFF